jgi:SAM-dependent methyltransferase
MEKYYGVFKDMKDLYQDSISEHGIYDDIFSTVYTSLMNETNEIRYYVENAFCVGEKILEVACGDGSNYMIPLAKKGFSVDGVEISQSMIDRFEENTKNLPARIRKNMHIMQGDIFEFDTDTLYDLIIIPSTTICLLADDDEKLERLFHKISSWLRPGGRFMFDYRVDQMLGNQYLSALMSTCNKEKQYFMMMQEFNNFVPGRAIVNMYVEQMDEGQPKKYIASSEKRIITDSLINQALSKTDFMDYNTYMINLPNAEIKLRVLEK